MINYDKVAEKIFAIIKGFGYNLSMFTIDGMDTSVPSDGRRFYVKKPNFMVTLDEENAEVKINKNSRVTLDELESVLKQLKNLAKQNLLNTQIKIFGKEITPKDFAYQAQKYKGDSMNEDQIVEASLSRMKGSKKTSYQTLESVKLIVRHRKPVAEEKRGARSRQIQAIFLEQGGERTHFPYNNLVGARAMARHMYEGGEFGDTIGAYIVETVGSILKLNEFVRYARTNKLMNEENQDVVKTVKENISVLRRELHGLTGATTYSSMSETIAAREVDVLEEDDVTDLQDMFTVKKFDEKLGDTLPLVRKLMNEKQAWRNALIEASTQTIFMHEKEELAEDDIMEFDNPIQKVGYKIKRVANRMVETGELQTFVKGVAGKLIEGQKINEFEKTVVRNVLENATVQETEETECDDCGCTVCECGSFDRVMEGFALKIKMLEHEDIFEAEIEYETCPECGVEGGHEDDCSDLDDMYKGKGRYKGLGESEGEKCVRCRKGTMHLGDTMYGPAKQCDRCGYQLQVNEDFRDEPNRPGWKDDEGEWHSYEDEDCPTCHGWGEVVAGKDSREDFNYNRDDVQPCPDCKWVDPAGGVHDIGEEDPAKMYEMDARMRKLAGLAESDAEKAGSGRVDPEDFMDDCPDCDGTGKAQDSIFDDDECQKCGGEGYV